MRILNETTERKVIEEIRGYAREFSRLTGLKLNYIENKKQTKNVFRCTPEKCVYRMTGLDRFSFRARTKAPTNRQIQSVFLNSTNTNITITRKVINRFLIGLKHFEDKIECYKMVKTE